MITSEDEPYPFRLTRLSKEILLYVFLNPNEQSWQIALSLPHWLFDPTDHSRTNTVFEKLIWLRDKLQLVENHTGDGWQITYQGRKEI